MTLQQLQYLVALAESNSINQAAQNLFVSQSGISKAIKQLESELGFPLLERSSRGITFTSRGTEFLHDAYSLIKQFHTMQDHYLQTEPQGMITMSITSRYYIFVAKAVAKMANLLKEHNYFIRLQEGKVSDIIQDVAARRSQLGFISYYDTNAEFIQHELERFNLEFHSLCSNQLHVFLSKNHPLAKEPNITLSMLSPYPYIFYDGGNDPYGYTEEVFFPVHPQKSIAVSDRSSMLNIIRHSECYNLGSGCWKATANPISLPAPSPFPPTQPCRSAGSQNADICWMPNVNNSSSSVRKPWMTAAPEACKFIRCLWTKTFRTDVFSIQRALKQAILTASKRRLRRRFDDFHTAKTIL